MTIFEGTKRRSTIMNTIFSVENGVLNTVCKLFLQKQKKNRTKHIGCMKAEKLVLGACFPLYQWFYKVSCFKNICIHTWGTRTKHVNFMNIDSKL